METLAREALRQYGLDGTALTFLRHNENAVYRVEDAQGGAYVLRLHVNNPNLSAQATPRRLDWLEGEMAFLQGLGASEKVSVQTPVCTSSGALVAVLPEAGFATLLTWIPGAPLDPKAENAPDLARAAGALAARLHAVALRTPSLNTLSRPRYGEDRMRQVGQALQAGVDEGLFSQEAHRTLREMCEAVGACMEAALRTPGAHGLIHADLGLGNLLVHEGRVSPIDFGLCGHGPLLFDVGGLMGAFNDPALRRNALEGYARLRLLEDGDMRGIEAGFLAGILLFMAMHHGNPHVREWFGRRLPIVIREHMIPFLARQAFLPQLLEE